MTSTSFVFTELASTMKLGEGSYITLFSTECRHGVPQKEVWGRGCYITLFSANAVIAFHKIVNFDPLKKWFPQVRLRANFFLVTWDMLLKNLTLKTVCYEKCPGSSFVVAISIGLVPCQR